MELEAFIERRLLNFNVGKKVVFILDGGYTEAAEVIPSMLDPKKGMYVAWPNDQKAFIATADEGKNWKFI